MLKGKEFSEKYPPMSPEEIEEATKKSKQMKGEYNIHLAEIEKSLTEFLEVQDPLLWEGKAIALIRRPSMKKLKELIPTELRDYVGKPTEIPEDVGKKYEKFFYEKMEEMIAFPKHTAKEWETIANPWFIRLFWQHIADIARLMEGQIEGF